MKTALITGASSGIGLEFARLFAQDSVNVVLVARSGKKLQEIKQELEKTYAIQVKIIEKDLSLADSAQSLLDELPDTSIDYLVNNAGFGDFGEFVNTSWEKEAQMIQLNVTTLVQLTKLVLKGMVARQSGKILNVASTAAFQPGPLMAIYYSTKAFVLMFSEGIARELKGTGVTVTALCPGPTESGFQDAAAMQDSKLVKGKKMPSAREVANYGYKAMQKGKTVAVHGFMNNLLAFSVRFIPRNMVADIAYKTQERSH
jgi:uncharacterized protein